MSASSPSALSTSPPMSTTPVFSGLTSRRRSSGAASISLASSLKPSSSPRNGKGSLEGLNALRVPDKQNQQSRKLVIKNAKAGPSVAATQNYANSAISTLIRAVRAILADPPEPTPESLQSLYDLCEGLVGSALPSSSSGSAKSNVAQNLYDRLRIEIERKVGEYATVLRKGESNDGEAWLSQLNTIWKSFNEKMLLVRSVLLYLDRTYVLASPDLLSIWDLGVDIFRQSIIADNDIGGRVTRELLQLINRERDGGSISQFLLTTLVNLLVTISATVHATIFVSPFIEASMAYYQAEGTRLIGEIGSGENTSMTYPKYLNHVKKRLVEEGERCDVVIGTGVKDAALDVVEKSLIGAHVPSLLENGLPLLLREVRIDDLKTMYTLLDKVSALDKLKAAFGGYVKSHGTSIVSDAAKDDSMVDSLIEFRNSTSRIIREAFNDDSEFARVSRDAFSVFINARQNKPAEMIAKFIDAKMRAGNKVMSDEAFEETSQAVLGLFRYCQGKDIFEAFYKKDFAKRLLLNRSASSDAEKNMLLKLKEECGAGFTAKLETMAKDIDLSSDIMNAYRSALPPESAADSTINVNILTAGNWPTYTKLPCRVPADMQKELDRFTAFYKNKHAGRSLAWVHGLDHCAIRADFKAGKGGGRKELNVSLTQALVILLFNYTDEDRKLGYKEIMAQTGLESKELARTLQSLACAKYKILTKHPKGRDVNETDEFSFNANFTDDKYRIRINQIQVKETVEEQRDTEQRVLLDRQSHLQLVIVRILKSRKTIKHTELIMEVVNSLKERFRVDPPEIKKAIDSLIDRDYMERNGRDAYNYVA
ncbi:hypothetical protein EMMF5_002078 [Cystobasidiomycetes sp. EMM_F5]